MVAIAIYTGVSSTWLPYTEDDIVITNRYVPDAFGITQSMWAEVMVPWSTRPATVNITLSCDASITEITTLTFTYSLYG
jgi:hypothetical protein